MARCTAPVRGHSSASAAARCPACRGGSRSYGGYSGYSPPSSYSPSYSSSYGGGGGSSNSSSGKRKASWSKTGSTILYTPSEISALTPVRRTVEKRATKPDIRDVFLCHAWDDRKDAAKKLNDLLESKGISVWFSEKDIPLGTSFLREIDKGLAKSKMGLVLVTPHFLKRVSSEGVADKELSVLLARDQLIPVMHGATYDELRDVSPLLGSRNGLDTAEDSMAIIADKLAELVSV
jgi:hypothetical protein